MSDNTGKKQETKFKKGKSGNPSGRPKGSLNKSTLILQEMLDAEGEVIMRKAIDMASEGDIGAIRLVLERLLPPCKGKPVLIDIPKIEKSKDIVSVISNIVEAIAKGQLTPQEAKDITSILDDLRRSIDTHEIEQRLLAVEEKIG